MTNLAAPVRDWQPQGFPLTALLEPGPLGALRVARRPLPPAAAAMRAVALQQEHWALGGLTPCDGGALWGGPSLVLRLLEFEHQQKASGTAASPPSPYP